VGRRSTRPLADDSATAEDRVGQVRPPDSELRATVGSVGHRSAAHRTARRCPSGFATRMLNVQPENREVRLTAIDVQREGEEYLTLYTTDDIPTAYRSQQVAPRRARQRPTNVKEILSGYTQIGGPPPPPPRARTKRPRQRSSSAQRRPRPAKPHCGAQARRHAPAQRRKP